MITKNHMSHLLKMSCFGACLGFAAVLAMVLTTV